MQDWKRVAHEAKDLLTVCLAKGIDQAMTARLGSQWFADFAQSEANEKPNTRIIKTEQHSVQDMDLQALLKFLRFRDAQTRQVLAYYHFFEGLDTIAADAQMQQLNRLLDRLMVDFRNRIEAHNRAADIEQEISGNGFDRIYGYEEAVQDMLRLARVFEYVTDAKGGSYYRRMEKLTQKKRKWWIPLVVAVPLLAVVVIGAVLVWNNANANADNTDTQTEEQNVFYDDSDPIYEQDLVTIQPIYAYYDGDSLVLECYINNGTDESIHELDVSELVVRRNGSTLAVASFGELNLQDEALEILPQNSLVWRFTFRRETVRVQDAALQNLSVEAKYKIKKPL